MAVNRELLLALLTEQREAIATADRCRRQMSALLTEEKQRTSLEQTTTAVEGDHSAEPPPKRRQQSTQPDDTSDEDLLEAFQLYEENHDSTSSTPARQRPREETAKERRCHAGEPASEHKEPQPQATQYNPAELESPAAIHE